MNSAQQVRVVTEALGYKRIVTPFLASHPVYDYLSGRYGFNWKPDEFPSDTQWSRVRVMLKKHPAKWMILEGEPVKASAERLEDGCQQPYI